MKKALIKNVSLTSPSYFVVKARKKILSPRKPQKIILKIKISFLFVEVVKGPTNIYQD
jgi:hypothetical protein